MSFKSILIPLLGAGAALTVVGLIVGRRDLLAEREVTRGGKAVARPRAVRVRELPPDQELSPHQVVLPLAFWDTAAELDTEDELPRASHPLGLSEEPYDSIDLEDASATWLARATQMSGGRTSGSVDDPAEIAADSRSMVSDASRAAAGADIADLDGETDDEWVESETRS
jgi:hypothetical protein